MSVASGDVLPVYLFAIKNEYGIFISKFSVDDAYENFFDYAMKLEYMTEKECSKVREEYYRSTEPTVSDLIIDHSFDSTLLNDSMATTGTNKDTVVSGSDVWRDDNGVDHPLRWIKVGVFDEDPFGEELIGYTYTDINGNYSFVFQNKDAITDFENGGLDIFVRIYSGDNNAMVYRNSSDEPYIKESSVYSNVKTGDHISVNTIKVYATNNRGQAFQISQAILTARNFTKEMMGYLPTDVIVRYPYGDNCCYSRVTNTIAITGNERVAESSPHSYASWDVVMHEYGHHIQYELEITNNPGGDHTIFKNHADDRGNKDIGIRLAWGEAWPTVFGLVAQKYYSTFLQNIDYVCDSEYNAYNIYDQYDIEKTSIRLGEASEISIMAILWDLFDENNDYNDNITLGYKGFWTVTTAGKCKTFSEFINYFYRTKPEYVGDIALNLQYYRMASSPMFDGGGTQTTPLTISWTVAKSSDLFPNNCFSLIFYDVNGNEILRTSEKTLSTSVASYTTSYTLTPSEWNKVLYSYGQKYKVAVVSYQTDTPKTGGYISSTIELAKPAPAVLEQTISMSANTRYYESELRFQPSQYMDYHISFAAAGSKIIQTFGTMDTVMYLYSSSGSLLASNDDGGYNRNAFIRYSVSANTEYIVRIKFYNTLVTGTTKLAITPTSWLINPGSNSIESFADIWAVTGRTSYTLNTSCALGNTKVMTFTVPSDGSYTFQTTGSIDTYMYIIDPRSSSILSYSDYDDDDGEGNNALITKNLEAGVPYLIIYSAFNIQSTSYVGKIQVKITKNS